MGRLALTAALLLATLLAVIDLRRPPPEQWSGRILLGGIHLYQRTVSPWMPAAGVRCRFAPTCSRYAAAVIRKHGAARGSWRALVRLLRCGPWTPQGTVDPP